MKNQQWLIVIASLLLTTARAHHSNAVFERSQSMTLTGTVTKFEWTNPHVWIWFATLAQDGSEQVWGLESGAPVQLRKAGFQWDSFKKGDKVTFELHPLRSGETGGQFVKATFADGHVLETPDPAAKEAN